MAVDAFEAALKTTATRGALVVSMSENISEDYAEAFMKRGIVSLYGFEEALQAAEIAADSAARGNNPLTRPYYNCANQRQLTRPPLKQPSTRLQAKQALARFGVPIPPGARITSVQQARDQAEALGYPLALKALGIAHKTEADALRLNLGSSEEVGRAAKALLKLSDQLYLESMVESVVAELIVGITCDDQFGLVLTLGSGGILVEIMRDSRTLLIPSSRCDIEQTLAELKSAPLFGGYRGKAPADLVAAVDAILAIQQYAISEPGRLLELDVNPLLLCAEGVFAADALIVLEEV